MLMDSNPSSDLNSSRGREIMLKKSMSVVFLAVAICLFGGLIAVGQDTTGAIVGTVKDTAGAAISGATVTATIPSQGNRVIRTVTTGDDGTFSMPDVPVNV